MNCPACATGNDDDAITCAHCGEALGEIRRGTVLSGRYEILELLGRGGMGVVYKARDHALDEHVAVKVLRADIAGARDLAERFRAEIRLARKVGHRNVCRIYEYGEHDAVRYIAMELIEGVDLKHSLRAALPPPARAIEIVIQIAKGLHAIHEHGIIHRDLKTSNIMVDSRQVIRLMDFGIAKKLEGGKGITATGHIVGTPEYMSPEQAKGGPIDVRSDIYSLGVVGFEVHTGEVPFHGDTPISTILQHLNEPPPLYGERAQRIPPGVVPLLARALAKDPAERFASARDMADALRALRPGGPATPTPIPSRTIHQAQRVADQTQRVTNHTQRVDAAFRESAVPTRIEPLTPTPRRRPTPARDLSVQLLAPEPRRPRLVAGVAVAGVIVVLAGAMALRRAVSGRPRSSASPVTEASVPTAPGGLGNEGPEGSPAPAPPPSSGLGREGLGRAAPARVPPASRSENAPTAAGMVEPVAPAVPLPAEPPSKARAPRTTLAPRPDPTPAIASAGEGLLQVRVDPECEITIDNQPMGRGIQREFPLAAGPHTVRLNHPDYQPLKRVVTVRAGDTSVLKINWAEKGVPLKER